MTLDELVSKSGTPALHDCLKELQHDAQFGRACRESLVNETVANALLLDFGAEEKALKKAFSALDNEDLTALSNALRKKAAALFPPDAQLPTAKGTHNTLDTAYII